MKRKFKQEFPPTAKLAEVILKLALDTSREPDAVKIIYHGESPDPKLTLEQLGIKDGDILFLQLVKTKDEIERQREEERQKIEDEYDMPYYPPVPKHK